MKCLNILKIMQLQLYLLIWCRAAETLTDQLTDLGQNVTINCNFDVMEVDWLLLKLPDPPVLILCSSTISATFYFNKRFKQKYSVQSKHGLFINNVTVDDLELYYCVTKDTPPKYSDGTRIYITDLLIWCRAAETLTDQLTDLGQNVTINCDLDVQEVNWLLLKLPDPPVLILCSSTTAANNYFNKTSKQKYSVQSKHGLFINNITVDDLGLYYCVTKDAPLKYSDGTRIYITEPSPNLESKNHTVLKYIEKNQTHWQIITLISAFISALLIIVIIGIVKVFVLGSKRTRHNWKQSQDTRLQQPQIMDLEQPQNSSQVQYATADFSTPCKRFQPRQINGTYALLELPESTTHNDI